MYLWVLSSVLFLSLPTPEYSKLISPCARWKSLKTAVTVLTYLKIAENDLQQGMNLNLSYLNVKLKANHF